MIKAIISIFLSLFLFSCSKEFNLIVPDNNDERVVVQGSITNEEGPYFFKLSLSQKLSSMKDGFGISNALIMINDNTGITDTLKLLPPVIQRHPKWLYYFITIKRYSGKNDTIRLLGDDTLILKGVYYTTKIQGIVGNNYSLKIVYKTSLIQAEEQMQFVPRIDSVKFKEQLLEKDGQNYYVPYIYFREPKDQINYYMFNFGSDNLYNLLYGSAHIWNFSILNDTFLSDYISGFNLDDGASPVGHEDFYYFNLGDKAKIRMLSLSKNAFDYYQTLLKQFENDGGAYSPTPASPPTNLTGNALGYFRVSAVSESDLVVK